jgi:hypothetical protein
MANVCETTITVVGLNDPAEIFVKALSKSMFGVDLDNLNPNSGARMRTWTEKAGTANSSMNIGSSIGPPDTASCTHVSRITSSE